MIFSYFCINSINTSHNTPMKRLALILLLTLQLLQISAQTRIYEGLSSVLDESLSESARGVLAFASIGKVTVDDTNTGLYLITIASGKQTLTSDLVTNPKVVNDHTITFDYKMSNGSTQKITFTPERLKIGDNDIQFILLDKDAFTGMRKALVAKTSASASNLSPAIKGNINLVELFRRPFGLKIDAGATVTNANFISAAKTTYGWALGTRKNGDVGFEWPSLNGLSLFGYPLRKLGVSRPSNSNYKCYFYGDAVYSKEADAAKLQKQITQTLRSAGWTLWDDSDNRLTFYKGASIAEFWFIPSTVINGKYECGFQCDIFQNADIVRERLNAGIG